MSVSALIMRRMSSSVATVVCFTFSPCEGDDLDRRELFLACGRFPHVLDADGPHDSLGEHLAEPLLTLGTAATYRSPSPLTRS